ncbi:MAG: hypothetical protein IJO92_04480 [Clostridia bacterium]|nr:hypothetical protein [Clostridia bacterium]
MNELNYFLDPIFLERALSAPPDSESYQRKNKHHREAIQKLNDQLTSEERQLFFDIEDSYNSLRSDELISAYLQGLRDGASLLKTLLL